MEIISASSVKMVNVFELFCTILHINYTQTKKYANKKILIKTDATTENKSLAIISHSLYCNGIILHVSVNKQ